MEKKRSLVSGVETGETFPPRCKAGSKEEAPRIGW